jgi:hypothetical protein
MNSKERIIAALSGQEVDHVPFSPFLAYVWEYLPKDIQDAGQLAFNRLVGADPLWRGAPCPVKATVPGVEYRNFSDGGAACNETMTPVGTLKDIYRHSESGGTSFLIQHPLRCEEDYKIQIWIEEHTVLEPCPEEVRKHFCADGREGLSIGLLIPRGKCKSAFQNLIENLVGTEELNYALADFPEAVQALLEAMVRNDLNAARNAAESEYEYFLTFEDTSTQNYSPAQYDRYIAPEISKWCSILAQNGKHYVQHACGHTAAVLPSMKAQGLCAVESLASPPTGNIPLREARKLLGPKVGIIGGIEPIQFLTLSERELVPYVEQVLADGGGGPFVLANADSCPPGVAVEKFKRVAEVARHSR